ncbi:hypothetical protein H6S82_03360 [Planktothrix sp. FACHB-1355]|uniref:Uncharacterized protein n=1 Tax=Aerosakkonema funiforme FACHB-1375 TaxID=2949571 RepID=A0A926ZHJ3_9CYAN|nr:MULTISPECIES: hypothetical protein [Oscillatoriales]MBD2182227.1 hypothetical protein [Aerosakkonema funiforme FACHB-1375]MBD3557894.1 hypothetical protein [Planktothrix sp. FACHB-1355]
MPTPIFDRHLEKTVPTSESSALAEIHEGITYLKRSQTLLYRMLNIDTWAIVCTMEDFDPGFWGRFMANRQAAFTEFLAQKKRQRS